MAKPAPASATVAGRARFAAGRLRSVDVLGVCYLLRVVTMSGRGSVFPQPFDIVDVGHVGLD